MCNIFLENKLNLLNFRNEQIDLTFFNPDKNGSIIDLGDIPIPIQTNISGHVITGIAPVDIGSISASNFNSINISESLLPGMNLKIRWNYYNYMKSEQET